MHILTRRTLAAAFGLAIAGTATAQSLQDLANQVLQQTQGTTAGAGLSNTDIAAGLRQALANGTRDAVNQLGRTNGFWGSDRFRIPLPGAVQQISSLLQAAGYGTQLEQLHLTMNRAAEQAVPLAADVFAQAVQNLTLDDARNILNGPQDAATQYFKRTTSATLTSKFEPVVAKITSKIGLVQNYNALLASAGPAATMLGGQSTDINAYVTRKALDGLYARVADEEKSIRTDPAARTTELLKKVFSSN